MPKDKLQAVTGESDIPETLALPGMPVNEVVARDGVSSGSTSTRSSGRVAAEVYTRDALLDMQAERDLAPSLTGEEWDEEDAGLIPLRKLGAGYVAIHPASEYEWTVVVTRDVRLSRGKDDPYLVHRSQRAKFPPSLLRVKRLVLCLSWQDGVQRPFLWLADWHDAGEAPGDLHKSIARVMERGRRGWGQALFDSGTGMYTWRKWSERGMGQAPVPIWPERELIDIVDETFRDRIIATPDHELILCIGEE
jgi:hypothetical protein